MSLTDYRSLYDKDFIGAWDLTDGDLTVTIKNCIGGSLTAPGGRKSKKPVVYMTHTEKGFALNATNGKTIAALYGNHVEKWAGKQITLYKSMTRSPDGSGDVECIRVRPTAPRQQKATAPAGIPPAPPAQAVPVAVAPESAAGQVENHVGNGHDPASAAPDPARDKLAAAGSMGALAKAWADIGPEARSRLEAFKNECKDRILQADKEVTT